MAKKFLDSNGVLYLWQKIVGAFVKKETGKGLSTNDFTDEQKAKLAGLENYELPKASADNLGGVKVGAGLSVNENGVLSATGGGTADAVDWANVQDKPATFPPAAHSHKMEDITDAPAVAISGSYKDLTDKPTNFAPSSHTHEIADVNGLANALNDKAASEHTHTKAEVGLGNVDNTSDANKPISTATQEALDGKINTSALGQANGVAQLDEAGLVPSDQLPSYVDDVVEGYAVITRDTDTASETFNAITDVKFYEEVAHTTEITGESGKIYIDLDTNLSFRWGGTKYVLITSSDMTALTNAEIDNLIKDTV